MAALRWLPRQSWSAQRPALAGISDKAASGKRQQREGPINVQSELLLRVLSIDRPATLNALDLRTLKQISARLASWERNYMVMAGVIRGNGTAFCGGTDVARVYKDPEAGAALRTELCRTAKTVAEYRKPLVSLIDGPVIGGGYALAHGRHRVATEGAAFFVYEPSFGLALEGGLSHVLPRLAAGGGGSSGSGGSGSSALGMCLGLTGLTLSGIDLVHAGLATAFMPADAATPLVRRMGEALSFSREKESNAAYEKAVDMAVFGCVYAYSVTTAFPPAEADRYGLAADGMGGVGHSAAAPLPAILAEIERCFGGAASVEETAERLAAAAAAGGGGWARQALMRLQRSSPLALKVTFEQLRRGADMSLEECLAQEFAAADALARQEEHAEAVAALLQDRDARVQWRRKLEDVTQEEVAAVLAPRPDSLDQ